VVGSGTVLKCLEIIPTPGYKILLARCLPTTECAIWAQNEDDSKNLEQNVPGLPPNNLPAPFPLTAIILSSFPSSFSLQPFSSFPFPP
jgi:hypothetical protein